MKKIKAIFLSAIVFVTALNPIGTKVFSEGQDSIDQNPTSKIVIEANENLPVIGSYENFKKVLPIQVFGNYMVTPSPRPNFPIPSATPQMPRPTSTPPASTNQHSNTNNQVNGVNESDIIKTDGKYIYQVSEKFISIIDAYPADKMSIASTIKFADSTYRAREAYLEGDKLVVIGTISNSDYGFYTNVNKVMVYDVTDRTKPEMVRELVFNGNVISSRMIGSYMYLASNINIKYNEYNTNSKYMRPFYKDSTSGNEIKYLDFDSIYYVPGITTNNFLFAVGFDIDSKTEVKTSAYLADGTNMYVSMDNMYIAQTRYYTVSYPEIPTKLSPTPTIIAPTPTIAQTVKIAPTPTIAPTVTIQPTPTPFLGNPIIAPTSTNNANVQLVGGKTMVYKFSLINGEVRFNSKGDVLGYILNQFSMDEYDGNFRIATTSSITGLTNNLYVLDKSMKQIGSLEGLANNERIYSVRFMGEKAIVVTFRQVDPLFVIDLKNPEKPSVLGELKIPGFSEYIHPYDENNIIGIGKNTTDTGRITGYKVAMFDITDPNNPVQKFVDLIGANGSNSDASYNHKAFLLDSSLNLMAFPILVCDENYNYTYQGVYVYNVDPMKGLTLKGKISHIPEALLPLNMFENTYFNLYENYINRVMYINDILYTMSPNKIVAHKMDDIKEVGSLSILGKEVYVQQIYKKGDANGDGVVDSVDYAIIKRYILGYGVSGINPYNMDVNNDGLINTIDIVLVRRYILEMIDRL